MTDRYIVKIIYNDGHHTDVDEDGLLTHSFKDGTERHMRQIADLLESDEDSLEGMDYQESQPDELWTPPHSQVQYPQGMDYPTTKNWKQKEPKAYGPRRKKN